MRIDEDVVEKSKVEALNIVYMQPYIEVSSNKCYSGGIGVQT